MIDKLTGTAQTTPVSGKILKMVHNPRMGGSVPTWVKADSAKDQITRNIANARSGSATFDSALAYQMQEPQTSSEEFGFYDLLDMVNPLQHIPLLNLAYRRITGDEIKNVPQIIGGAIFGGPAGAASGFVNVIVQEETGKDLADNAMALASGDGIHFKKHLSNNPEVRLADALTHQPPLHDLPVSLLAFADTGAHKGFKAERIEESPHEISPYEIY